MSKRQKKAISDADMQALGFNGLGARKRSPKGHTVRGGQWAGHIKNRYGLTMEAYDALIQEACGRCQACGHSGDGVNGICLDHDHVTGRLRGILCGPCNRALGLLNDSPTRVLALALYITPTPC